MVVRGDWGLLFGFIFEIVSLVSQGNFIFGKNQEILKIYYCYNYEDN